MRKLNYCLHICAVTGIAAALCISISAQASKAKPKATPKPKTTPAKAAPQTAAQNVFAQELFAEINKLRANPAAYIALLEQMRGSFKGNTLSRPNSPDLVTNEGVAAVNDAIVFLKTVKGLKNFKFSNGLRSAANDHLQDMIKNDLSGHKGSDGSLPPLRVDRYGSWRGDVKENISYHAVSVKEMVLNMLVDDGNAKREHRKNLLSPTLQFLGIVDGEGKNLGRLSVLVFATQFSEKP